VCTFVLGGCWSFWHCICQHVVVHYGRSNEEAGFNVHSCPWTLIGQTHTTVSKAAFVIIINFILQETEFGQNVTIVFRCLKLIDDQLNCIPIEVFWLACQIKASSQIFSHLLIWQHFIRNTYKNSKQTKHITTVGCTTEWK